MARPNGKSVSSAARLKAGQVIFEIRINKENIPMARLAMERAAKKLPCPCKIVVV
jgi:large subunit ribosomal protein L10e